MGDTAAGESPHEGQHAAPGPDAGSRAFGVGASPGSPGSGPAEPQGSQPDVVLFTTGAWRERIGWWRSVIVTIVVVLAAAAVIVPSVAVLRHYQQMDAARAQSPSPVEPAQNAVPASSEATASGPAKPTAAPPAVPTTMAPSTAAAPAASAATPAATKAAGRASAGAFTVSFVMDSAELHAGKTANVSVSATGDTSDHVSSVQITTADGATLNGGDAEGCSGPALPWSQSFPVVFPTAESTQLQVRVTSCAGGVLVATAVVDIQP